METVLYASKDYLKKLHEQKPGNALAGHDVASINVQSILGKAPRYAANPSPTRAW